MVLEPNKEELHIDRTYFKITNPEEEAAKAEMRKQQLENFKKLLERLEQLMSKNPAQELIQELIEERLKQELEKQMKEQQNQDAQNQEGQEGNQDGDQGENGQEGEGQDGQDGNNDGNQQSQGQGSLSDMMGGLSGDPMIQDGASMSEDGEIMGFSLSDEEGENSDGPSFSISIPRDMYNIDKEEESSDGSEEEGDEEGEGGSGESKGKSEDATTVSEKDFTLGGSTHGAQEIGETESKKVTVSKKTRFK